MVVRYESDSNDSTESVDIIAIGNGDGAIWEEIDDSKLSRDDDGRPRDRSGLEQYYYIDRILGEGERRPAAGTQKEATDKRGINWLTDRKMLPSILSTSEPRIMEFLYSKNGFPLKKLADLFLQSILTEYKEWQPVVFIAYGHGGLVLELAIMLWYDRRSKHLAALALSASLAQPPSTPATATSPPKIMLGPARHISEDTVETSETLPATRLNQGQPETSFESKPKTDPVDSSQGIKLTGDQPQAPSESKSNMAAVDSSQGSKLADGQPQGSSDSKQKVDAGDSSQNKLTESQPHESSGSKPNATAVDSPPWEELKDDQQRPASESKPTAAVAPAKKNKRFPQFRHDKAAGRQGKPARHDGSTKESGPTNNSAIEIGKAEPTLDLAPDMSHVAGIVLLGSALKAPKILPGPSAASTAKEKLPLQSLLDACLQTDKLGDMTDDLTDTVYHTCFEYIVNEVGLPTQCYRGSSEFDPEAGKPFEVRLLRLNFYLTV